MTFAYLFGSRVRGGFRPRSDLDITVYLSEGLDKSERFELGLRLMSDLSVVFHTDRLDLLLLRDLPLSFQFRVVKEGKLIYCKDEFQRIRFEFRVMFFFLDRQYYYRRHTKFVIEQIAKEGIL